MSYFFVLRKFLNAPLNNLPSSNSNPLKPNSILSVSIEIVFMNLISSWNSNFPGDIVQEVTSSIPEIFLTNSTSSVFRVVAVAEPGGPNCPRGWIKNLSPPSFVNCSWIASDNPRETEIKTKIVNWSLID